MSGSSVVVMSSRMSVVVDPKAIDSVVGPSVVGAIVVVAGFVCTGARAISGAYNKRQQVKNRR